MLNIDVETGGKEATEIRKSKTRWSFPPLDTAGGIKFDVELISS